MASSKYKNVYEEVNAVLVTDARQAVVNFGTALRLFESSLPIGELDAVIQEMWATRLYIDNPSCDRRAAADNTFRLAGRWHVSSLRKNGPQEKPGIYEELRLGFLQPPGTPNDYPKSKDANDWSGIFSQARVVKMFEYDQDNRAKAGENRYYILTIPGVAPTTIKEFCAALSSVPVLENPTFGIQTKIPGTWKIRGVRNEEQDDGSSVVFAMLVDASGLTAGEITMEDGWNQTVVHQFYKHIADYPDAPFHPVNIDAVDTPTIDLNNGDQQTIHAVIYQIVGAEFDGMWNITVVKRTAKPSERGWGVSDRDGAYTIQEFWNQTYRWTQLKSVSLPATCRNGFQSRRNEFNLYDGSCHIRPGEPTTYSAYYNKGFYNSLVDVYRWDHGGRYIKEVWKLTLREVFGKGTADGLTDYYTGTNDNAATPTAISTYVGYPPLQSWSHFNPMGGDKYTFKRVVKAELMTSDITGDYDVSSRGTFVTEADSKADAT